MKKILIGMLAVFALVLVALPTEAKSPNAKGPAPKVDVCHVDGTGTYHLINISENALQAHLNHGDAQPSNEGLDADCAVVEEWSLLETVTVDSASQLGASSTEDLEEGKEYKFVVSGDWTNRGFESVDAKYVSVDAWANHTEGPGAPGVWDPRLLDLQIDEEFVDWGVYSTTNEYEYLYTPAGAGTVNFRVFDGDVASNTVNPGWYSDNVGDLTVEIYGN